MWVHEVATGLSKCKYSSILLVNGVCVGFGNILGSM